MQNLYSFKFSYMNEKNKTLATLTFANVINKILRYKNFKNSKLFNNHSEIIK